MATKHMTTTCPPRPSRHPPASQPCPPRRLQTEVRSGCNGSKKEGMSSGVVKIGSVGWVLSGFGWVKMEVNGGTNHL